MKNKKKPNIVLYTILMLIVFIIITELIIWGYGSGIILEAITNYPQGNLVITEAVLASLVLIVMLLFKNSYVFTQKREKFTKGLFYGLYYIFGFIILTLISGVASQGFKGGLSIINLIVGCFFVGVAEEFLCRGWLLNEFLERFGDTKKGVWYSIFVSGIIFGLIHLGNIYSMGQSVPQTIIQVISAAGTGIVFGLIYYKTKNIWSVVVLHGLWDFSIFLSDVAPVSATIESVSSFTIVGAIFSILMVAAELLNLIPYIKDIDAKPKKGSVILCSGIGIVFCMIFTILSGLATTKFGNEYYFDSISIKNYSITRDNYEEYYINYTKPIVTLSDSTDENNLEFNENVTPVQEDYKFSLKMNDDDNLVFTNLNTNYSIVFECESLYDYIIMEPNNSYYILAYVDYTDSSNPFLNYIYIDKDKLSNDNEYMDNIKNNMKKYLLSERSELLILNDREKNISYLSAYNVDYGHYLLVSEDKMAILNRDN